jgi:hypothetical protein
MPLLPGGNPLLRTHGNPAALAPALTSEFQRLDADLPLTGIMTMKTFMDWPTLSQRIAGTLLGAFGMLAMSLAAIGLYGVMSFAVSRRTREVGIRMALGARPGDIWRMVLRSGAILSLIGLAIGLSGALLLMPRMSMLLIGVGPPGHPDLRRGCGRPGARGRRGELDPRTPGEPGGSSDCTEKSLTGVRTTFSGAHVPKSVEHHNVERARCG